MTVHSSGTPNSHGETQSRCPSNHERVCELPRAAEPNFRKPGDLPPGECPVSQLWRPDVLKSGHGQSCAPLGAGGEASLGRRSLVVACRARTFSARALVGVSLPFLPLLSPRPLLSADLLKSRPQPFPAHSSARPGLNQLPLQPPHFQIRSQSGSEG